MTPADVEKMTRALESAAFVPSSVVKASLSEAASQELSTPVFAPVSAFTRVSDEAWQTRIDQALAFLANEKWIGIKRFYRSAEDLLAELSVAKIFELTWTLQPVVPKEEIEREWRATRDRHRAHCPQFALGNASRASDRAHLGACTRCFAKPRVHADKFGALCVGVDGTKVVRVFAKATCACGLFRTHCLGCVIEIVDVQPDRPKRRRDQDAQDPQPAVIRARTEKMTSQRGTNRVAPTDLSQPPVGAGHVGQVCPTCNAHPPFDQASLPSPVPAAVTRDPQLYSALGQGAAPGSSSSAHIHPSQDQMGPAHGPGSRIPSPTQGTHEPPQVASATSTAPRINHVHHFKLYGSQTLNFNL